MQLVEPKCSGSNKGVNKRAGPGQPLQRSGWDKIPALKKNCHFTELDMTLYHNSRMILHAFASRSPKTSSTNSKSVIFTLFPNFRSTNPKESGKQSPFNPLCVHSFCKAQKHLWRYVISPEASLEIWRYVLRPEASLEICCTVFC